MSSERATLNATPRTEFGSRISRRLRREGKVPGVVYSDGNEAVTFQVESRDARVILGEGHALFDLQIEGSKAVPVVVKEQQHHPVRGDLQHLDLQQVDLNAGDPGRRRDRARPATTSAPASSRAACSST